MESVISRVPTGSKFFTIVGLVIQLITTLVNTEDSVWSTKISIYVALLVETMSTLGYLTGRKGKKNGLHSVSLNIGLVIKRKIKGYILSTDYFYEYGVCIPVLAILQDHSLKTDPSKRPLKTGKVLHISFLAFFSFYIRQEKNTFPDVSDIPS